MSIFYAAPPGLGDTWEYFEIPGEIHFPKETDLPVDFNRFMLLPRVLVPIRILFNIP
jgi:hypothetical protein